MQEDERKRRPDEDRSYQGDTSGGYGTGGAAADFEDVTGQKDPKLEDVFPEEADPRRKRPDDPEDASG